MIRFFLSGKRDSKKHDSNSLIPLKHELGLYPPLGTGTKLKIEPGDSPAPASGLPGAPDCQAAGLEEDTRSMLEHHRYVQLSTF